MALFNYATKEITLKIVYYGPGLSGKTTNIQHLHSALNPENKGKLLSLSTESDRTLFFDFLPIELGKIKEFSIRFQLYTVPGQVRYNATRKVVLKGADAVVFVADSQSDMRDQNIESLDNMRENLISNNINPDQIPVVLQYNKRDLKNILTIDALNADLNKNNACDVIEAEAINGKGVEDSFQLITRLVLKEIARKHKIEIHSAPLKEEVKREEKIALIQETPIEKKVNQQEKIAVIQEMSTELFQLADEAEAPDQPDSYELAEKESIELVEPEYDVEEKLKETFISKKVEPEPEPETHVQKYAIEKTSYPLASKESGETKTEIKTETKRSLAVSDERIKLISSDVTRLNTSLAELKGTVSSLKAELREMKDTLSTIKNNTSVREDKHITEIRKEQREIRSILTDIAVLFSDLKVKKSWFKF